MAKSPKTIGLPLSKALNSNKFEDLQHHFELINRALDNMYKLLLSDITTVTVGSGSAIIVGDWIYFGGINAVGSARIGLVGTDWVVQHFIAGNYASRLGSSP